MEGPAVCGPVWGHGLSGHGRHHELGARGDAVPAWRSLIASPLEKEGAFVSKECAFEKRGEKENGEDEKEKKNGDEDDDCENVQELSDLFSSIESEAAGDSAIDFSVLLEGEHAFNVEEVSEIFSDLEDVAVDAQDAECVDDVAALFSSLQEQDTDAESDSDSAQDVENVDELSDLFSALEEQDAADKQQAHEDWIASLDVDHVSGLFTELEELQQRDDEVTNEAPVAEAPKTPAVDPRIFVPSLPIRMEGRRMPVVMALPRVAAGARLDTSAFLVGPPCLRAGPPVLVAEKRKLSASSTSPVSRTADAVVSETRRASAAKRRRVNGRFVREQNAFVSITQLQ